MSVWERETYQLLDVIQQLVVNELLFIAVMNLQHLGCPSPDRNFLKERRLGVPSQLFAIHVANQNEDDEGDDDYSRCHVKHKITKVDQTYKMFVFSIFSQKKKTELA